MKRTYARVRLFVAALLFVAWLGWLFYLAFTASDPVVLSRPQFLVASAHIIAEVSGNRQHPDGTIVIDQVKWAAGKQEQLKEGAKLTVGNLAECGPAQGWEGPGKYILPLSIQRNGSYAITITPRSPGYPPPGAELIERVRIYPVSKNTLYQLHSLENQAAS